MQNSNQQDCLPQKRACVSFSKYKIFTDFQQNQNKIIAQYQKSSKELLLQSLQIITAKIFGNTSQNFLKKKPLQAINQPNRIQQLHQKIFQKIVDGQAHKKENFSFSMKKKNVIQYDKKSPQRLSKGAKNHNKLINQLSRLSVDQKFIDQNQNTNQRDTNETDLLKFDQNLLKNKTITQLLQESKMKTQNRKDAIEHINESQSSEEQYQMTDYSSNQSSNDDKHYDQVYMFQDQMKPLFGNMFVNKSQSQQSSQNSNDSYHSKFQFPSQKQLSFNSKQLLESPKKTKSQRKKRLFIREKKIPKWAEDLKQVSTIVKKQRSQINPNQIYGHFVVENLQTNSIFNINEDYKRTSSAKWAKNKNGYVY